MKNLNFIELMEIFLKSKNEKNLEKVIQVNEEFARRVKKRELMGKKPMRTSLMGLEQTQRWLNDYKENPEGIISDDELDKLSELKEKDKIEQKAKDKLHKVRKRNLREPNDIKNKKGLW